MITQATYLTGYSINVLFDDGTRKNIDLYEFLSNSKLPMVRKYLDIEKFRQFRIEDGTLVWGENELDLNPMNIYDGVYDA